MSATNSLSVSLRNLEKDTSYVVGSGNARVTLADGRGKNKKAQESGHIVRDILSGAIKTTRELCSTGELKGPQEFTKDLRNVLVRVALASLRS